MRIPCWSCGEPRDNLDEFCPQCGAGEKPVPHVDTKEEITAKIKADPEVKEYLKGVEDDTKAEMKEDARKAKKDK